jgi:hypothetical protein
MDTMTSGRTGRRALLAVVSAIAIGLAGCGEDDDSSSYNPGPFTNALGTNGHIGGAIDRVAQFDNSGTAWVAYSVGSSLVTTQPGNGNVSAPRYRLDLAGVIEDIEVVMVEARRVALVAMGRSGVAAVDLTNPAAPALIASARVMIDRTIPMTVDSGGNEYPDFRIFGPGEVVATASDGTSAWLADHRFGIHKIALATLLNPASRLADGSLPVESQLFTLTVPHEDSMWGTPTDLRLYEGRLFATLGVLGLAIYDPATLEKVGGYNLYLDTSMKQSRFYGADVKTKVQSGDGGLFLDAATGMPDYRQAQFELTSVLRDGLSAPTPWYDLARGGHFFYSALSLDIAKFGERTIAYIAYNNAGLVAVDVSGFGAATPAAPLAGSYLAYLPAVMPSAMDDEEKDDGSSGLWAMAGLEMYGETGTRHVAVNGTQVWVSDHLGGLISVGGADDPAAHWRGPAASYDNDTDGIPGNTIPPWEFVTSFDMTPVDAGGVFAEPLPAWLYQAPALLATGEAGTGHGRMTLVAPNANFTTAGTLDLVLATQAYGLVYADIVDLSAPSMTDRYAVLGAIGGVDAFRINVDGTPTGLVDLSETTGTHVSGRYLYVADAPHGAYAFRIRDSEGTFLEAPEFVGATLPGLVSATIGGVETYPIHHAKGALFDRGSSSILVPSGGWGLRRGNVAAIENGQSSLSSPALITVRLRDLFEHKTTFHPGSDLINGPDRAFDVAVKDGLAYVADGVQGLTIYDLARDPVTDPGFVVSNLGGNSSGGSSGAQAIAYAIALWYDPETGKTYAFMAANRAGIAVIDVTNPATPSYVKVFQPYLEQEEGKIGAADGTGLAVKVLGDNVVLGYGSFGAVVYRIADLIAPLPAGVDPQTIWDRTGAFDHRPKAVSELRIWEIPGYEYVDELDGTVKGLDIEQVGGRIVWIAHGVGVARVDYANPQKPVLLQWLDMTGDVASVHHADGRVYVATSRGGLWILK